MAVIKSSTNGTTWTTATVTGDGSTTWATSTVHSLAYSNGIWAAGSNVNLVALSTSLNSFSIPQLPDNSNTGTTWTTVTSNFGNTAIISVAYGNGLWVAGGNQGQIRTSTDAITWTTRNSNFGNTHIQSVAYGNSLWVAGGYYGQIRTSTDAITWTTQTSNFGNTNILSVAYGNGLWVAGGGNAFSQGQIRTSTDAVTWTTQTSNFGNTIIQSVAYGNSLWVAGGRSGQIRTSTDAITWTTRTSNFGNTNIRSVAYGNGLWVAGGNQGQIRTSTDAITWTTRNSNFGNTQINSIAYANDLWVVGGFSGQLRTSTDAITWTTQTSNFGNTGIQSFAYGNGLWVAGGGVVGLGEIRTSPQLYNTLSLPNTQISSFNALFIAVSNNRPRSSTDGITWTTVSGFEGVHVNKFVESQGKHMLLGNSGVLYEKNTSTTTWTTRSTGINDNFVNGAIRNNGGTYEYIIQGNNAIYSSTNLTIWTTISLPPAATINDIIAK